MAQRRRADGIRDWLYLTVGLGGLGVYIFRTPEPNWMVVACLCALAGRPVFSGLADVIGKRNGKDPDGS